MLHLVRAVLYNSIGGEMRLKTIFDLREKQEGEVYKDIQNLYDEPLKVVRLATESITACIGCWNCWLKTPGRCVMKDQMAESYPDYVNSDTVILLIQLKDLSVIKLKLFWIE